MNYEEKGIFSSVLMSNEHDKHQHEQRNTRELKSEINLEHKTVEKQLSKNPSNYSSQNSNVFQTIIPNTKPHTDLSKIDHQLIENTTLIETTESLNCHVIIDMSNDNQIRKRRSPSLTDNITTDQNPPNNFERSVKNIENTSDLVDYSHILDDSSSDRSNFNDTRDQEQGPLEGNSESLNGDLMRIRTISVHYPRHIPTTYFKKTDRNSLPFIKRFYRWLVMGGSLDSFSHSDNIRPHKNYEAFPSKSVFFLCGGRFILGDDTPLNLIVFGTILVVGGLYFGFV